MNKTRETLGWTNGEQKGIQVTQVTLVQSLSKGCSSILTSVLACSLGTSCLTPISGILPCV